MPHDVHPKMSYLGFPLGLIRAQVDITTEVYVSVETITTTDEVAYWEEQERRYIEAIPERLELLDQVMKLRRDSDSD